MKKGAGEGWSCRFWLKACDLLMYLNPHFRSYQFEEEVLSSQTFIIGRVNSSNFGHIPLTSLTWVCNSVRDKSVKYLMIQVAWMSLSLWEEVQLGPDGVYPG